MQAIHYSIESSLQELRNTAYLPFDSIIGNNNNNDNHNDNPSPIPCYPPINSVEILENPTLETHPTGNSISNEIEYESDFRHDDPTPVPEDIHNNNNNMNTFLQPFTGTNNSNLSTHIHARTNTNRSINTNINIGMNINIGQVSEGLTKQQLEYQQKFKQIIDHFALLNKTLKQRECELLKNLQIEFRDRQKKHLNYIESLEIINTKVSQSEN